MGARFPLLSVCGGRPLRFTSETIRSTRSPRRRYIMPVWKPTGNCSALTSDPGNTMSFSTGRRQMPAWICGVSGNESGTAMWIVPLNQSIGVAWRVRPPLIVLLLCVILSSGTQAKQNAPTQPTIRVAYVTPAATQPGLQEKSILFSDDFDQTTAPDSRYLEYNREGGSFVRSEGEGYGGHGAAMKCQFEKGQVEAGGLKVLFGKNPLGRGIRAQETFREIYWRVYVRHEIGWEGNPAKLGRATCLAGTDWSQGFIAHVWGGPGDALCIDPATGIVDSHKVTTRYNDFAHLHWLGSRQCQTPLFSSAESGRWVCIESHIRLNTPGRSDG